MLRDQLFRKLNALLEEEIKTHIIDLTGFNEKLSITPVQKENFNRIIEKHIPKDKWTDLNNSEYKNIRYAIVSNQNGKVIGFLGVYDYKNFKNVTQAYILEKYAGNDYVIKFKELAMKEWNLPYVIFGVSEHQLRTIGKLQQMGAEIVAKSKSKSTGGFNYVYKLSKTA